MMLPPKPEHGIRGFYYVKILITLAEKYNLKNKTQVEVWVNQYEEFGEEGLRRKMTKIFYSGEFKLAALSYP